MKNLQALHGKIYSNTPFKIMLLVAFKAVPYFIDVIKYPFALLNQDSLNNNCKFKQNYCHCLQATLYINYQFSKYFMRQNKIFLRIQRKKSLFLKFLMDFCFCCCPCSYHIIFMLILFINQMVKLKLLVSTRIKYQREIQGKIVICTKRGRHGKIAKATRNTKQLKLIVNVLSSLYTYVCISCQRTPKDC